MTTNDDAWEAEARAFGQEREGMTDYTDPESTTQADRDLDEIYPDAVPVCAVCGEESPWTGSVCSHD